MHSHLMQGESPVKMTFQINRQTLIIYMYAANVDLLTKIYGFSYNDKDVTLPFQK